MKTIFAIILSILLTGCGVTWNINDGPGSYDSYYEEYQNVYYWNGQPYYGYFDGFYYYYGYPHTQSWNFYYKHKPPFWYRPENHVQHSIVYVYPMKDGWTFNNRKGGVYKVPKRHRNPVIQRKPHTHEHHEEDKSDRDKY
jgi:hypothetical protein